MHIFLNCTLLGGFCVGFQQKEKEHLQRVFGSELCIRDAEETPICLCLYGDCHAEGKGSLTYSPHPQTHFTVNFSLSNLSVRHHLGFITCSS